MIESGSRVSGAVEELTAQGHQTGSGGEKAVALHLPLFAAMAAHLSSAAAHAPRLVMLDEAFAGVDANGQEALLGLMGEFDFDFMLTSHDLWGCTPKLARLSVYSLHREKDEPGVMSSRFLWDGQSKHIIDDDAAPAAA